MLHNNNKLSFNVIGRKTRWPMSMGKVNARLFPATVKVSEIGKKSRLEFFLSANQEGQHLIREVRREEEEEEREFKKINF